MCTSMMFALPAFSIMFYLNVWTVLLLVQPKARLPMWIRLSLDLDTSPDLTMPASSAWSELLHLTIATSILCQLTTSLELGLP